MRPVSVFSSRHLSKKNVDSSEDLAFLIFRVTTFADKWPKRGLLTFYISWKCSKTNNIEILEAPSSEIVPLTYLLEYPVYSALELSIHIAAFLSVGTIGTFTFNFPVIWYFCHFPSPTLLSMACWFQYVAIHFEVYYRGRVFCQWRQLVGAQLTKGCQIIEIGSRAFTQHESGRVSVCVCIAYWGE